MQQYREQVKNVGVDLGLSTTIPPLPYLALWAKGFQVRSPFPSLPGLLVDFSWAALHIISFQNIVALKN